MWIVRLALRRPYTFVVMAMLIVISGVYAIVQMPTDILPEIDIPVIAVVWQYGGLPPDEMEQRFTGNDERALTTTVAGIEHIESQSLYGVSVTKVYGRRRARRTIHMGRRRDYFLDGTYRISAMGEMPLARRASQL